METIEDVLERINHQLLKCGSIRKFSVVQKNGFKLMFYIREIAEFRSLSDLMEFLLGLEKAIEALEDYY